ncbi:unnamed protein product [Symbiodinium sp. CCMP2592]|nr:unnamed protein product [Symbiodinium sp. CCMP2592]
MRQVFGVLRAPKADIPTLLSRAGEGGVFVYPPAGQRENVVVEWIDRLPKEADRDYFARASRLQSVGLACHGARLGWKKPITADTKFRCIWTLSGCPRHWDMVQATDIVKAHFDEVKLIRQSVRGAEKTFYFRGAAKKGADCDLLPIPTQDGDSGRVMLWAALAPARQEQVKQKRLRGGSMPYVEAAENLFTPVTQTVAVTADATDQTCQAMDTSGGNAGSPDVATGQQGVGEKQEEGKKEEGAAKRAKVTVREIPAGCSQHAVAKDGNCLYHSFGEVMRWLGKQPNSFHHLDLRARVAEHLSKHKDDYEAAWKADGRPGPAGTPLDDWDAFIREIAIPGRYSGEIELMALCRLFSVRIVIVPADPNWRVCSYGKTKQKDVSAIYFKDRHFDFIKPDGEAYPREISATVADPNGGFLVGGVSEACSYSVSDASTVRRGAGMSQAQTSVATAGSKRRAGMSAACSASSASTFQARSQAAGALKVAVGKRAAAQVLSLEAARERSLSCLAPLPEDEEDIARTRKNMGWSNATERQRKYWDRPFESMFGGPTLASRRTYALDMQILQQGRMQETKRTAARIKLLPVIARLEKLDFAVFPWPRLKDAIGQACKSTSKFPSDFFALFEVDVAAAACPGYLAQWKAQGYKASLSALENGKARVALVSRVPFKPVRVCTGAGASRHAAGIVNVTNSEGRSEPLLLVATYCQAGNPQIADAQLSDIVAGILRARCRFVVLGDFNMEAGEGAMGELLACGMAVPGDACARGQPLPCTGPGRRRRIDYAIHDWRLAPTEVTHFEFAESDHLCVSYRFPERFPVPLTKPARAPFKNVSQEHLEVFFASADFHCFECALDDCRLDDAWTSLSAVAEQALCGELRQGSVPRHEDWLPSPVPDKSRPARRLESSDSLARFRKLLAKLRALKFRPWDSQLRAKIFPCISRLRARGFHVPFLPPGEELQLLEYVDVTVKQLQEQEDKARSQLWKTRMESSRNIRGFVKKRAEAQLDWEKELPLAAPADLVTHPAERVKVEAKTWSVMRTAKSHADPAKLCAILECVPRPADIKCDLVLHATDLKQAVQAMKGRAAGPDSWTPEALALLPLPFWRRAADLWNRCVQLGQVPTQWSCATTVLIPKPKGGSRPLTLCQVLWRAGASVLQRRLRPWISEWQSGHDAGGLPGASVEAALAQIQAAFRNKSKGFVQLDVKAFFDSIQWDSLSAVLQHLRFPLELLKLLLTFYKQSCRTFVCEGAYDGQRFVPSQGIPQGCPFSPCLAAAIAHVWCKYVLHGAHQHVSGLNYMDDRLLFLRARAPVQALDAVLCRSAEFDECFNFKLSLEKCAVYPSEATEEWAALADKHSFSVSDHLEILGVSCTFGGAWSLLKFVLRRAVLRLRWLRWCSRSLRDRKHIVQSLVVPMVSWTSAYAAPSDDELNALETNSCTSSMIVSASIQLGWKLHPQMMLCRSAFRTLARFLAAPPNWVETVPLTEAFPPWNELLPEIPRWLQILKWTYEPEAGAVVRRDCSGRRRWLSAHFRALCVDKCGRLWRSFHRSDDEQCATGLDLPAPPRNGVYLFRGHGVAASETGGRAQHLASFGSGGSCWHFNAGGAFPADHRRWLCLCGESRPSRPHLTWACPVTQDLRVGHELPVNRAEEGLFAKEVVDFPPPTPALDLSDFLQELSEGASESLKADGLLYAATDGSARNDIAASAIVFGQHVTEHSSFAAGTGDEDQSAFKAEMQALLWLATVCCEVSDKLSMQRELFVVSDCLAAISACQSGHSSDLPGLARAAFDLFAQSAHQGLTCTFLWVPSHGKQLKWAPPEPHSAATLRALNESADEVTAWEVKTVRIAAAAAERLSCHLRSIALKPGERPLGLAVPPPSLP